MSTTPIGRTCGASVVGVLAIVSLCMPAPAQQTPTSDNSAAPAPPAAAPKPRKRSGFGVPMRLPSTRLKFPNVWGGEGGSMFDRKGPGWLPSRPQTKPIDRPVAPDRPVIVVPDRGRQVVILPGGTTISGNWSGDNWRVGFRIGSDVQFALRRSYGWSGGVTCINGVCSPSGWNSSRWDGGYVPAVVTSFGPVDPFVARGMTVELPPEPAIPPPTEFELAAMAMEQGEWSIAAARHRRLLEVSPQDAVLMRSLAMVLLELRQVPEAVAMIAMAYETDPTLARRPFEPDSMRGGSAAMRARVITLVNNANRSDTASGWLAVAVAMQAEGPSRFQVANRMLQRATERGLSNSVSDALAAELRG